KRNCTNEKELLSTWVVYPFSFFLTELNFTRSRYTEPYYSCRCSRCFHNKGRWKLLYEQYHDAYESRSSYYEIKRFGELGNSELCIRHPGGCRCAKFRKWEKRLWCRFLGE